MPILQTDSPKPQAPSRLTLSEERRKAPVLIGVLSTVLFHLLLWFLASLLPVDGPGDAAGYPGATPVEAKRTNTFDFVLEKLPEPEPPADPSVNVDTNPDAPSNEPDKTNAFSDRNQQAAQPVAAVTLDPQGRPATEGDKEILDAKAIQAGNGVMLQDAAAATPQPQATPGEAAEQQDLVMAQTPFQGVESISGDAPDGVMTSQAPENLPEANSSQLVIGSKKSTSVTGGQELRNQTSKVMPKPRPKISQHRKEIVSERTSGVARTGLIASTAFKTEYGDYLEEVASVVGAELDRLWDMNALRYNLRPGTHVTIMFKLNAEGEVVIKSVEQNTGLLVSYLFQSAITNPQPYRKWTKPMQALLGEEQTLTYSLHIQ